MLANSNFFSLVDLSKEKMNHQPNKNIISKTFANMIDLPLEKPQSNSIIYVDNKNFTIFTNPINIYNDGYIFSSIPSPYSLVPKKDGTFDIEIIYPKMNNDLSLPILSEHNSYNKILKRERFIPIIIENEDSAPGPCPSNLLNLEAPGPLSPRINHSDR